MNILELSAEVEYKVRGLQCIRRVVPELLFCYSDNINMLITKELHLIVVQSTGHFD